MLQFYLAKIIKRSEFYYADFDYMMGMDCVNYRQLYTATGFPLSLRLMPNDKNGSSKLKEDI